MKIVKYTIILIGMIVFTLFLVCAILGIYDIYTNFGTGKLAIIPATVFMVTVGFLGIYESIDAIKRINIYKRKKKKGKTWKLKSILSGKTLN